jgi:hypothetical protein
LPEAVSIEHDFVLTRWNSDPMGSILTPGFIVDDDFSRHGFGVYQYEAVVDDFAGREIKFITLANQDQRKRAENYEETEYNEADGIENTLATRSDVTMHILLSIMQDQGSRKILWAPTTYALGL